MTRFSPQSFSVTIAKKYAVSWLKAKGWEETSGYNSIHFVYSNGKYKDLDLDTAVEIQIIKETP